MADLTPEPAQFVMLFRRDPVRALAGVQCRLPPLPPDHPFKLLDNTLLMPHVGYVTEEQYRVRYRDTVEDIAAYLGGAPLRVLNLKVRETSRPARNCP